MDILKSFIFSIRSNNLKLVFGFFISYKVLIF